MRFRTIAASAAVLAAAAGGASTLAVSAASAATVQPAAVVAYQAPHVDQLRGHNQLTLTFQGKTYTYDVRFRSFPVTRGVELIQGSLRDTYEPSALRLPIEGIQFGNDVVFSVSYPATGPDAGNQGVRTFSGVIDNHGNVTGSWSETGTEAGSGPWSLVNPV